LTRVEGADPTFHLWSQAEYVNCLLDSITIGGQS